MLIFTDAFEMRKICLLIIPFCLFAGSSFSQHADRSLPKDKKFAIGLSLGMNYANFNGNRLYNEIKPGFMAGGVLEYFFHGSISAQAGVYYVSAGAKTEDFIGRDDFGNEAGKFHFAQELKFLEFPILLNYNMPVSKFKLCLNAGSNIGFLLSAREELRSNYQSNFHYSVNIKDRMDSINIMFEIGGGAVYSIGSSYALKVAIKYDKGLTNQISEERTTSSQKSKDLRLIATVFYKL